MKMIVKSVLLTGLLLLAEGRAQAQSSSPPPPLPPSSPAQAQEPLSNAYLLVPVPDVWFNQIDGFRLGIRIKGQEPMSFNDGPHQLDMGVWIGSKWPDLPISYYITLTEPLTSWSSFGNEASLTALSSVREGYAVHGLIGRKRWQQGFNEAHFIQLETKVIADNRFDLAYPLHPQAWQTGWQYAAATSIDSHREWQSLGRFTHSLSFLWGISKDQPRTVYSHVELSQVGYHEWSPRFGIAHRILMGIGSSSLPLQHRYQPASGKAVGELQSGFTRSTGFIPSTLLEQGRFHLAGGPNLRGYARHDDLNKEVFSLSNRIVAANLEVKFPNPVSRLIQQIPILGSVLNSRMYLFSDLGKALEANTQVIADAGLGFAVGMTIPDMTGQTNALTFRMDVPMWVSHPSTGESAWKLRPLFGLNSVITW